MVQILKDSRAAFRRMFLAADEKAKARLDDIAAEMAQDLFSEIIVRQPTWTGEDPLRPGQRPSERQGLVPIHRGWLGGPTIEHNEPDAVDILLKSESEHVKYFTSMMGRRPYLGTKNTHGIDAKPGSYLRFWFLGREFRAKHVGHRGFAVEEDFARLAWDAIVPRAKERYGKALKASLIEAVDEVP